MSYFDEIKENEYDHTLLKKTPIKNHKLAGDKSKISIYYWRTFLDFCKTFEKITKQLGFHLKYELADLKDIICTASAKKNTVTIKNLNLLVPR